MKVGDGVSKWSELEYFGGQLPDTVIKELQDQIAAIEEEVTEVQEIV